MASGNDKGRGLSDALHQANVYSFNGVLMLGLMDIMLHNNHIIMYKADYSGSLTEFRRWVWVCRVKTLGTGPLSTVEDGVCKLQHS